MQMEIKHLTKRYGDKTALDDFFLLLRRRDLRHPRRKRCGQDHPDEFNYR